MVRALVIISSDNVSKALTGLMWATNALRYRWVEDVEVIFFGPVERLLAEGRPELVSAISELMKYYGNRRPLACKRVAELEGFLDRLTGGGLVDAIYVGGRIAELIAKGYAPLVF